MDIVLHVQSFNTSGGRRSVQNICLSFHGYCAMSQCLGDREVIAVSIFGFTQSFKKIYSRNYSHVTLCCICSIHQGFISSPFHRKTTLGKKRTMSMAKMANFTYLIGKTLNIRYCSFPLETPDDERNHSLENTQKMVMPFWAASIDQSAPRITRKCFCWLLICRHWDYKFK